MMLTLRGKHYYFQPKLLLTVVTLILFILFIFLGIWQLQRAQTKQRLQANYQQRLKAPPLPLAQLPIDMNKPDDLRFTAITVTGNYDNSHTFLLDNKSYQHQIGYEVVTLFIPDNSTKGLLVNRGWIKAGTSRTILPAITPVTGKQTINGIIYFPAKKPFVLKGKQEALRWPLRIQAIKLDQLATIVNKSLYPFTLILTEKQPGSLIRAWQPVTSPHYKHFGYALQWFGFAIVLVIIYLILSTHKRTAHENN